MVALYLVLAVVFGLGLARCMVLPVVFLIFVLFVVIMHPIMRPIMRPALVFQNTILSLTTATLTVGGSTTPRRIALPPYLVISLL